MEGPGDAGASELVAVDGVLVADSGVSGADVDSVDSVEPVHAAVGTMNAAMTNTAATWRRW